MIVFRGSAVQYRNDEKEKTKEEKGESQHSISQIARGLWVKSSAIAETIAETSSTALSQMDALGWRYEKIFGAEWL